MKLFDYITADIRQIAKLGDSVGNWTPAQQAQFEVLSKRTRETINGIKNAVLEEVTKPDVSV